MVSISASARQNLLALIDTTNRTDDISAKMVAGKRVLSISDNAFSFYQAKSFDDRMTNLAAVNDKVGVAMKTLGSADKGVKGIKTELSKLEGLLKDLTTSSAANASMFQATGPATLGPLNGTTTATSIFNRTGTTLAPIDTGTSLVESADSFSTAGSIFRKTGVTGTTLLTASGDNLAADLKENDVLSFKVDGKELFLKVVGGTGALIQDKAGNSEAEAIEVRTINDLVNALNGKRANGTTDLLATALFDPSQNVSAGWNVTDGLMVSSSSTAARTVNVYRSGVAAGTAGAIFGGTAGTTTNPSTTTIDAPTAIGAGQFRQGDIIQVRVGNTSGGGTQQSLFMKVTKNFTGTGGAQRGDGLSAQPGGGSTGALEVRTIGDIINALNGKTSTGANLAGFSWGTGNTVSASFDSSTSTTKVATVGTTTTIAPGGSRFALNSSTDLAIAINRVGAPAASTGLVSNIFGGPTGVVTNAGTIQATTTTTYQSQLTSAALEKRISVARVFQASLDQVDNLTNDATFGGNNLLNNIEGFNVDLTDASSASTLSKLQVKLTNATDGVSLGFTKLNGVYQDGAESNFNTNALVNAALTKVKNAQVKVEGRQVEIDGFTDSLKTRSDFNNSVKASLGSASNDLTSIDQNEATAQAQAINFANSVATKFLGTIGQRSQQLLQIF